MVKPSPTGTFVLWAMVSVVVAMMSLLTWPALAKPLLAYAVGARVPVIFVMWLAIRRGWGTSSPPPSFRLRPARRWLDRPADPGHIWAAFTLAVGTAFSAEVYTWLPGGPADLHGTAGAIMVATGSGSTGWKR